jgi:hypothetical protein
MKLSRGVTYVASLGLLAGCASVHGPRDPGADARLQALLERQEAMYGHESTMNSRLAIGCSVNNHREYYPSGRQWRYRSSACRSDD